MERVRQAETDRQKHVPILELEGGWGEGDEQTGRQKRAPVLLAHFIKLAGSFPSFL